jgi:hypothetical protein
MGVADKLDAPEIDPRMMPHPASCTLLIERGQK